MASSKEVRLHKEGHWSDTPKGEAAQALALHLGLSIVENLGIGSMGEAFKTSDGKVIKITSDKSEYYTSKTLVGQEIDHVNIIYRCLKIKYQGCERYAIVQKYVSQKYRSALKEFDNETCFYSTVQDLTYGCIDDDEFEEYLEEAQEECEGNEDFLFFLEQYAGVARNLTHNTEYFGTDFFYRNSGWDEERQQIVAIDLGYSSYNEDEVEDEEAVELK